MRNSLGVLGYPEWSYTLRISDLMTIQVLTITEIEMIGNIQLDKDSII